MKLKIYSSFIIFSFLITSFSASADLAGAEARAPNIMTGLDGKAKGISVDFQALFVLKRTNQYFNGLPIWKKDPSLSKNYVINTTYSAPSIYQAFDYPSQTSRVSSDLIIVPDTIEAQFLIDTQAQKLRSRAYGPEIIFNIASTPSTFHVSEEENILGPTILLRTILQQLYFENVENLELTIDPLVGCFSGGCSLVLKNSDYNNIVHLKALGNSLSVKVRGDSSQLYCKALDSLTFKCEETSRVNIALTKD